MPNVNLSILFAKKFIFKYQISKLIGFCMVVCGCLLQNSLDKPSTERFNNKSKARNAEDELENNNFKTHLNHSTVTGTRYLNHGQREIASGCRMAIGNNARASSVQKNSRRSKRMMLLLLHI